MNHTGKLSVLIVDDSKPDRYLLQRDLEEAELDVRTFESGDGKDALEFLANFDENKARHEEQFPPHIIFLDINMPRLDGFAFLERFSALRASITGLRTCVIMMFSTSGNPADVRRAMTYEFVRDYIVKGETTTADLRHKIDGVLAKEALA